MKNQMDEFLSNLSIFNHQNLMLYGSRVQCTLSLEWDYAPHDNLCTQATHCIPHLPMYDIFALQIFHSITYIPVAQDKKHMTQHMTQHVTQHVTQHCRHACPDIYTTKLAAFAIVNIIKFFNILLTQDKHSHIRILNCIAYRHSPTKGQCP